MISVGIEKDQWHEKDSLKFAECYKRNLASTSLKLIYQFVDFIVNFQQIIVCNFLWITFFCGTSTMIICWLAGTYTCKLYGNYSRAVCHECRLLWLCLKMTVRQLLNVLKLKRNSLYKFCQSSYLNSKKYLITLQQMKNRSNVFLQNMTKYFQERGCYTHLSP